MSKNKSASGLINVINYDNYGNISLVSGSTTLMQVSSSGQVTVTGVISGSSAESASLAQNSLLLSGTGSVGFTTTGSFTTLSASFSTTSGSNASRLGSLENTTSSLINASSSFSTRTTQIETVYATTGSNSFRANQSITGSLTVTGQIIAQTINVQQVTSSIVYSSGSNVFGCDLNSRQTFTGSLYVTGSSHTIYGSMTANSAYPQLILNNPSPGAGIELHFKDNGTLKSKIGTLDDINSWQVYNGGAIRFTVNNSGNVGIGTSSPVSTANYIFTTTNGTNGSGYITQVNGSTAMYLYSNANDSRIAEQRSLPLIFETSGTQRVSISAAGTSSFTANPLSSAGDAGTITLKQNSTTANTGIYLERSGEQKGYYIYVGGSLDSLTFQRNNAGTKADVMALTRDGNVGIGTTNPSYALDICSNTASQTTLKVKNSSATGAARILLNPEGAGAGSTGDGIVFFDMNSTAWAMGVDKSDGSKFKIANDVYGDFTGCNYFTVTTAGNVGINMTAPSQKLHVIGGFLQTAGNSSWYRNVFETNVTTWSNVVGFTPGSSPQYTYGYIDITANAYVNGTSAGGATTSRWYYSITNNSISVSVVGSDIVTGGQAPSIRLNVSGGTIYVQVQSATPAASSYTTVFVDAMLGSGYVNGTYWTIS